MTKQLFSKIASSMKDAKQRLLAQLDLDKPEALSWGGWACWHDETKKSRPFAYFVMETVPDAWDTTVQRITRPVVRLRHQLRYRVFDRYHLIDTKLPVEYHDTSSRLLHGMFSLLVDHVEIEMAWTNVVFSRKNRKQAPWWSVGWTRVKSHRNRQAGLDHLRWEMTLDDSSIPVSSQNPFQAAKAREIWELYHWWTVIRLQRPDPHAESGWGEYCSRVSIDSMFSPRSDEDQKRVSEMIDHSTKLETMYDQEDEAMLIRLVRIRNDLWT
jgi:hypothetical protein